MVGGVLTHRAGLRKWPVVDERGEDRLLYVGEQAPDEVGVGGGGTEARQQGTDGLRHVQRVERGQHRRAEPAEVLTVVDLLDAPRAPW